MIDESYQEYLRACGKYSLAPVVKERYEETYKHASKMLSQQKITLDKHPYIVYNLEGMYVKFKKMSEDRVQVNFFNREDYQQVISKYKEDI